MEIYSVLCEAIEGLDRYLAKPGGVYGVSGEAAFLERVRDVHTAMSTLRTELDMTPLGMVARKRWRLQKRGQSIAKRIRREVRKDARRTPDSEAKITERVLKDERERVMAGLTAAAKVLAALKQ